MLCIQEETKEHVKPNSSSRSCNCVLTEVLLTVISTPLFRVNSSCWIKETLKCIKAFSNTVKAYFCLTRWFKSSVPRLEVDCPHTGIQGLGPFCLVASHAPGLGVAGVQWQKGKDSMDTVYTALWGLGLGVTLCHPLHWPWFVMLSDMVGEGQWENEVSNCRLQYTMEKGVHISLGGQLEFFQKYLGLD